MKHIMAVSTYPAPGKFKYKDRPQGTVVDTVVMHSTAGSGINGVLSTLQQRGLAYHYIIDRDGKVYKLAPASKMTSHAGSSYGPHEQEKGVSTAQYPNNAVNRTLHRVGNFKAGCSVNSYTIGISFNNLNDGKEKITKKQMESARALVIDLQAQFGLKWVTAHFAVSPGRKSDPRLFDLNLFAYEVGLEAWHL